MPLWRRLRRRVWWLTAILVMGFSRRLHPSAGRALGALLGRAGLALRPGERQRALAHVAAALPDLEPAARKDLVRDCALHLGSQLHDMLNADRMARVDALFLEPEEDTRAFGTLAGQLEELSGQGRGLILLTGHLGCWELLGARIAHLLEERGRGPLAVVTGTVHNPPVDDLLNRRRRSAGLLPLARRRGMGPLVRHLKEGGVAAVLLDQKLADDDPLADFFGMPAPTPTAILKAAIRHGIPVLPVAMAFEQEGRRHVIRRLPVLNREVLPAEEDATLQRRVAGLAQECQNALEIFVRRNPVQWVWFHERWLVPGNVGKGKDDPCGLD